MKTSVPQPGLFDAQRPPSIECSGGELEGVIADLKARGAVVLGMTAICNATYRLAVHWPETSKPAFPARWP